MKKLTLAAAGVMSLIAVPAMAQSTVTLYGLIDAAVTYTTKQPTGNRTGIDAGQLATSRWGMRGNEDLGGGTRAFFNLEGTLVNDTGAAGLGFGSATPGPSNTPNPAGALLTAPPDCNGMAIVRDDPVTLQIVRDQIAAGMRSSGCTN